MADFPSTTVCLEHFVTSPCYLKAVNLLNVTKIELWKAGFTAYGLLLSTYLAKWSLFGYMAWSEIAFLKPLSNTKVN